LISDPLLSQSDFFTELISGLTGVPSVVGILAWVGDTLRRHLGLEQVWIGHPAALDSDTLRCYWMLEIEPNQGADPDQARSSQLRLIQPQIFRDLQSIPDHLLWIDADHSSIWQEFSEASLLGSTLSSVEELILGMQDIQAVQAPQVASLSLSPPPGGESQPAQLLGACYPVGELPWLLGMVCDREQIASGEERHQIGVALQLATLALERQGFLDRAQRSEQKQRNTANRWMDRFRVATEATRQVVYEWDIDAEQMEWTGSIRSVFGHLPTEETETRDWWSAQIHPEDRQRVFQQVSQCLDDLQVFLCEYRWRRADGYYAWVRDYGRILCGPQGYAVRMIGSLEDISSRRRTTKLLQRLQQELSTTMALSPVPILIIGTDLLIIEFNPALEALLGYDQTTLHQMSLARIVHPADLDGDLRERRQMFEGEIENYVTEKRLIHAEGHEITTLITVSMLGDGIMDREMIWQIRVV